MTDDDKFADLPKLRARGLRKMEQVYGFDMTDGTGDFFGELSLMRDEPHSKSAQATEQTELMAIPRDSFSSLLASDSRLREVVDTRIAERLAANDQALTLN